MTQKTEIYQIGYDKDTIQKARESGFLLLDNTANERPDWYEYWPIRNFLLTHTLPPDTWLGFFSPKFTQKTTLKQADVTSAIQTFCEKGSPDVILFSPQADMGAFFLNVFEQAENFDPGFIDAMQQVFSELGLKIPLRSIIMDSRKIVFSNYFVAKSDFWKEWFAVTEAIFAIAENPTHPLSSLLNQSTSYKSEAQRKAFTVERIASLLLTLQPKWKTAAANSFNFAWSVSKLRNYPNEAFMSDALKIAFRETAHPQYIEAFDKLRDVLPLGSSPDRQTVPSSEKPEISIIIPTYKRTEKLKRTLDSIPQACSSTYEVIVIDDCPDGSAYPVALRFGAQYFCKAGLHRGVSRSRNLGLKMTNGRLIVFLDDDDFLTPHGLDHLHEALTGGYILAFGNHSSLSAAGKKLHDMGQLTHDHLLICNRIPIGAYMIYRSSIQREFDERMRSHEDWDFLLQHVDWSRTRYVPEEIITIDNTETQDAAIQACRRSVSNRHSFWLDFISIYSRFPAPHLNQLRHEMLLTLGVNIDQSLLSNTDAV